MARGDTVDPFVRAASGVDLRANNPEPSPEDPHVRYESGALLRTHFPQAGPSTLPPPELPAHRLVTR